MNNKNSDQGFYEDGTPGNPGPSSSVRSSATMTRQGQQEIINPVDALNTSALDVGVLRMEMDLSMEHALRHPRDIGRVISQIKAMALHNEAAAARCVYALPRKDKAIIGPSIGLATICATSWGNCNDAGWWIRTDRQNKVVVCAGTFFDLQTNRRSGATVTRRVSGKGGFLFTDDMIAVTIQAATSIAQRNAIFKGIPDPIWRSIYEEALIVVRGTTKTLPERRQEMLAWFANYGVAPERVLMALGCSKETEITLDHMVVLRGMAQSLREESVTAEEMFDPRRMTGMAFDQVDNPLADAEEDEETTPTNAATTQGSGWNPPPLQQQQEQKPEEQGIWKGVREPSHQESTQARQEPVSAAAASAIPTQAPAPKAHPAPPKAAERPSFTALTEYSFTAPAEYYEYAKAWISASKSAADIDDRWKGERTLRNGLELPLDEDQQGELTELRKARMAELAGGRQ